jgi:hypothetical protein
MIKTSDGRLIFVVMVGTGDVDVVLSSGFLAFANHSGFLEAVEEVRRCCPCIPGT